MADSTAAAGYKDTIPEKQSLPTYYMANLKLGPSRNAMVLKWGMIFGFIIGTTATLIEGATILGLVGLSATPVAIFCLPIVMVLVASVVCSMLLRLISWQSGTVDTRHCYHGVRMVLGKVTSSNTELNHKSKRYESSQSPKFQAEVMGKKGASVPSPAPVELTFKLSISRFGRGAIPMAVIGAAAALTAGWFLSSSAMATGIFGLVGISASATAVAFLYPLALMIIGAGIGILVGGVLGYAVGKFFALTSGYDSKYPTYRNAFTQVRLEKLVTSPNQGASRVEDVKQYRFLWTNSSGGLLLRKDHGSGTKGGASVASGPAGAPTAARDRYRNRDVMGRAQGHADQARAAREGELGDGLHSTQETSFGSST